MDTAQGRLSHPMPDTVPVSDAPRRLSRRFTGLSAAGASPRTLLRRMLLGSYGTCACVVFSASAVCWSVWRVARARRWRCLYRRGLLFVVILAAVMNGRAGFLA